MAERTRSALPSSKIMASGPSLPLGKGIKEPLVSTSQGYCSTNLLTQEVSQHIALYDAQLHGTFRDSSLRVPVQGDCRERCEARFPKLS